MRIQNILGFSSLVHLKNLMTATARNWMHDALSYAWQIIFAVPPAPSAAEKSAPLLEILGMWELPLALLALGLGILVVRLNPQRSLNRYLATVLFLSAIWHILFILALRLHPGLPYLRASNAAGTAIFAFLALLFDCILQPFSAFGVRILRERWVLLVCVFAFLTPFTGLWIPFNSTPEHPAFGVLHPALAIVQFLLPAFLSARALSRLARASAIQRIELQSFATLTVGTTIAVVILILARRYNPNMAHLGSVLFGCCYVFGTWMLVSPKVVSPREVRSIIAQHSINMAVRVAFVAPVLILGEGMPMWQLAFGLVLVIYPGGLVADFVTSHYFSCFSDPEYDMLRHKILAIVSSEWIEARLTRRFCDAITEHLGVGAVETWSLFDSPPEEIPQARRLLVAAASKQGWLSVASAYRTLHTHELKPVLSAFQTEEASLVLVDSATSGTWVLVIGQQSSLQFFTDAQIRFLTEMLVLLRGASERIRLAGKAAHNDRLAMVGFLASQMRHEERNRMDSIRAGLELLKFGRESDLGQEHRDLLFQTIEEFIHDFNLNLDLARSDFGHIEVASAHAVIQDSIGVFGPLARGRNVAIETSFTEEPDTVKIDQRLLRQVLLNLFKNSADATESIRGSRITVRTSTLDKVFLIEVADNGPGVAQGIYNQLFTDFCTTKSTGTGLGLSICRDALSLMNGTIRYVTPKGEPNARFLIGVQMDAGAEQLAST